MSLLSVVEKAIEDGDLQLANTTLLELSPEERLLLPTHHIYDLPILHFIARNRFVTANQPELEKLIEFYISNGYDINLRTDKYDRFTIGRNSFGFTALLASVEQSNHVLLLSLIKNGADVNVRDNQKQSACHWAVYVGDFSIFKTLIEKGAQVTTTESEKLGKDIHPILHTAVDQERPDIVFYLLDNKLVDVGERVAYPISSLEDCARKILSRYNFRIKYPPQDELYSPFAQSVKVRNHEITEILFKFNAKQSAGFSELHFCIVQGSVDFACVLLDKICDVELANDKIGDEWALHCLYSGAFQDDWRLIFTKKLIQSYINSGWDVNSTTLVPRLVKVAEILEGKYNFRERKSIYISNFTLLHIACLYGCKEIVEWLIKKEADVNVITGEEGDLQMTPLQLCIFQCDWENAKVLLENGADPCVKWRIKLDECRFGDVKKRKIFSSLPDDRFRWLKGAELVELLLRVGYTSGEAVKVFDELVKKGIPGIGGKELRLAIKYWNPTMICKVFENIQDQDKLNWGDFVYTELSDRCRVFSIFFLVCIKESFFEDKEKLTNFANLLEKFADFGYDYNISHGRDFGYHDPLIFYLIKHQFNLLSNILLSRMLIIPHVCLAVRNQAGQTPVEFVLSLWNSRCILGGLKCWECGTEENYCCQVVEMLIHHGADMSNVTIGNSIKYHHGYEKMMKMLISAGVKLSPEFFTSPICHIGHIGTRNFSKELDQLKEWMRVKEKEKMSLKEMAKLKVRSMLSSIDHLKILNGLPEILRDEVLCKIY